MQETQGKTPPSSMRGAGLAEDSSAEHAPFLNLAKGIKSVEKSISLLLLHVCSYLSSALRIAVQSHQRFSQ